MIGRQIRGGRIGWRCDVRILRRERTSGIVNKNSRLTGRRVVLLDACPTAVIEILRRLTGRRIIGLSLLVVAVKCEASTLGILNEVTVKVVNITLPGLKPVACLVNVWLRDVVYRQDIVSDDLVAAGAVIKSIIAKCQVKLA